MRRLRQTIVTLTLTLGLLAPGRAWADWLVTYCQSGVTCTGFFGAGTYLMLKGSGAAQVYLQSGSGWVYQGPYGLTTTPLPADLPTVTFTGANDQVTLVPKASTWSVEWYASADEVAQALNQLTSEAQAKAKIVVSTAKNVTRYGLVKP